MSEKVNFGSKIGLIAATVGSAVGLGNIWRFPAEAQANGGAAFLLVYVACVFLLGIPVMVSEFALGRGGRSDAVGVYRNLSPRRPWWLIGALAIIASYCILCFYMVVAGWTLEYLVQSVTGALFSDGSDFRAKMVECVQGSTGPLVNTYLMIGLNLVVLLGGVRKGIERLSNFLMPLLFILLVIFIVAALSLPAASDGLRYFLYPDFSKVTPKVVIDALGQAFFSLSLGMGILVTYASYYPASTRLTRTAVTVSLLDMLVAVMMGIIIFPAIMSFGLSDESLEGATLVFVTLPEVFNHMPAPQLWAILFFLLLMVAALTSTISIAEVTIAFFQDRCRMSRVKATLFAILPLLIFSTLCSLSLTPDSTLTIGGRTLFDTLDTVATNVLLPIGALGMCLYMGWGAPSSLLRNQITNDGSLHSWVLRPVGVIIRWIAPVLIALILVSQFVKF
ncbi:MAG: sodium-dependent transporter [Muribaculaceae bacterium]|nr:sodium-dependent transporter [Muribaculaceae bacterium]